MPGYVEVWKPAGVELVALDGDRVTIGRGPVNDIPLTSDGLVSSLHAVLEAFPGGWCIRDLGSRNGTYLQGDRIMGDRALRHGDELRLGRTRLVFRSAESAHATRTKGAEPPPELTRRERDVLQALCRPLFSGEVFSEPASLRDIAAAMVVTEAAVKQHLLRLYEKFGLPPEGGRRRVQLANEAIRRGAVTAGDMPSPKP